ncbi:MAG: hypothetical protein NT076_03725 [Candidatus Pacearchaeota archaeon]|nr:hypothetical protein [Candidatus Pacearchaeota archaeon]
MTDQIKEQIRKNPYYFIKEFYEKVYMHMGREVFSTLALVIPSLILPPIPHEHAREIKPSINFLLITPPGNAKSSLSETFEKLAYNSMPFEAITDAKFYDIIKKKDFVSICVGDVFKIFSDKILSKTMENVLGDEQKLSRMTMRTDSNEKKIRAVAFLAGTPNTLTTIISEGMIFRTAVCLIFHTPEEHEKVGEFVNDGAFKEKVGSKEEEEIMQFYFDLLQIQLEKGEIPRINGYIVSQAQKDKILRAWKPLVKPITRRTKFSFFRELHQAYRYMCAHAFLNIFNKEERGMVKGDKLVIEDVDVDVAVALMTRELETKFEILSSNKVVSEEKLKTSKDLAEFVERCKRNKTVLKDDAVNIMGSLVK